MAGESSYSARVGLRQLSWHDGHLYPQRQRLQLHGATIQEDAHGHGDALTPADEDRIVAELKAIGANAARAQHPLDPALLERLDAAGILVWQGIGPVEGAGNWYSNTPAPARRSRAAGAHGGARRAAAPLDLRLEPRRRGRRQRPRRQRGPLRAAALARWLHAHDPTRMVAVDVWGDHPPHKRRRALRRRRRGRRDRLLAAGTTRPPTRPPSWPR